MGAVCPLRKLRSYECEGLCELRDVERPVTAFRQKLDILLHRNERVGTSTICVRLHAEGCDAIQRAAVFVNDIVEFGFAFRADQVYSSRGGFHECIGWPRVFKQRSARSGSRSCLRLPCSVWNLMLIVMSDP